MQSNTNTVARRSLLLRAGHVVGSVALCNFVKAQPQRGSNFKNITITQIVDMSANQQDVSKDFLIGSRAAWQDFNTQSSMHGRVVSHSVIETDGTTASARIAWQTARDNPENIAVMGTVADPLASMLNGWIRDDSNAIAHIAPWLQNSSIETGDRSFPIFATRQDQIAYALKSLSSVGLQEIAAVFASAQQQKLYSEDVDLIARNLKLRLQSYSPSEDVRTVAQQMTTKTPAVVLFLGGTPELVPFTQGLEKQNRQRYVIALADVNLQTLRDMGASRNIPVIATQCVPMVNASLGIVRSYHDALRRYFDEPPSTLSLAGYIAARYTFEALESTDGPLTRSRLLTNLAKRTLTNIGGFRIASEGPRRSGSYVTQSMLTSDGRVVG